MAILCSPDIVWVVKLPPRTVVQQQADAIHRFRDFFAFVVMETALHTRIILLRSAVRFRSAAA
jgi:hypothetical protein